MTIIRDTYGKVIRRSRNLRGLVDHASRLMVTAVEFLDTDGRLLELLGSYAEHEKAGVSPYGCRRYEMRVTYANGDIGQAFWADWRVAADWLANRRTWRTHILPRVIGERLRRAPLAIDSDVPGFIDRYKAGLPGARRISLSAWDATGRHWAFIGETWDHSTLKSAVAAYQPRFPGERIRARFV